MNDQLVMVEAALFQLKSAATSVDPMYASQMQLMITVLSNAIESGSHGVSAAIVNDIEFALNDVAGLMAELSAADAKRITPIVTLLQEDVARLKESVSLPATVLNSVRVFQAKLKERRDAIERYTFRPEGAPAEPVPHPPESLQKEAVPLRQQLAAAGFATPALDGLIADPSSLRFHSIGDIVDELDVIVR
jgi:hypothetical protein